MYFIDHQSLLQNGCFDGMYVTTVFLLDTSASMTGTGLEQMKSAFKNIIHGKRNINYAIKLYIKEWIQKLPNLYLYKLGWSS